MEDFKDLLAELDQVQSWPRPGSDTWQDHWGMGSLAKSPEGSGDVVFRIRAPERYLPAYWKTVLERYCGRRPAVFVGPLDTPGLSQWLMDRGYYEHDRLAILTAKASLALPRATTEYFLLKARSFQDFLGFHDLEQTVFGYPIPSLDVVWEEVAQARQPGTNALFIVRDQGRVVAAGGITGYGRWATFWGGQTHPRWRGQGLYKSLVARRLEYARTWGTAQVVVEARQNFSFPILVRWGFSPLAWRREMRPLVPAVDPRIAFNENISLSAE